MRFIFLYLLVITSFHGHAQLFEWANTQQLNYYANNIFQKAVIDASGNIFTTLNKDGGGTSNDFYLEKRATDGTLLWTKNWAGVGHESISTLTVDGSGNIILTGTFPDPVDFDPGPGVYELSPIGEDSNSDLFVLKLTNDGDFIWAISMGAEEDYHAWVSGQSIEVDAEDNIIIAGAFEGSIDFDHGPGVAILSCPVGVGIHFHNGFILKLSPSGDFIWAKELNGGGSIFSLNGIDIGPEGEVYVTGRFDTDIDFDPGPAIFTMSPIGISANVFILKLSVNGDFYWAKQIGDLISRGNAIKVTGAGDLICTGYFYGVSDFDPNDGEFLIGAIDRVHGFILKLNPAGELIWAKELAGTWNVNHSLTLDSMENIYLTGEFEGSIDLDPGELELEQLATGASKDIFILKLDSLGEFIWGTTMGSSGDDFGGHIAVNSGGDILNLGRFRETVDFDPSLATYELTQTGLNNTAYLLKLGQCDPFIVNDTIATCEAYTWRDGHTYEETENAGFIKTNPSGCDSIFYLTYTRNYPYDTTYSVLTCEPYTWVNGITYGSDTSLSLNYLTAAGCDSILYLEYDHEDTIMLYDPIITCDPFTWIDGNIYLEDTTVSTFVDDGDCPTIWTLELTNPIIHITDNVNSCDTFYTWTDGVTYFNDTIAVDTIYNPAGCDTVKTLYLDIVTINTNLAVHDTYLQSLEFSATSRQWLNCEPEFTPIFEETGLNFFPPEAGMYALKIEKLGCVDTTDCYAFVKIVASIDHANLDQLQLYPNPGTGHYTLILPNNADFTISIINAEGKKIHSDTINNSSSYSFDLNAAPGLYYVLLHSKNEVRSLKLIQF